MGRAAPQRPSRTARLLSAGGLTTAAALASAPAAEAADFTVSNLEDSGPGSLRQAIIDAQASPVADRALFQSNLSGTIAVADYMGISDPVDIVGPGASQVTIDGGGDLPIFYILADPGEAVGVSGLTLTRGSGGYLGGAISSQDADLTISDAVITGNAAPVGAGVGLNGGRLTVENSTVSGNRSTIGGAGVTIFASDGASAIVRSTISANTVEGDGGGIFVTPMSGPLTIDRSTISGNTATDEGGAIIAPNSTVSLTSSTVAGNTANDAGGLFPVYEPMTATNTIVADNTATVHPDFTNALQASFSLIETTGGAAQITETVPGSNIVGQDPELAALAANGGPTQTQALAPTSPALDRGSATGADQRGVARPFDLPDLVNSTAPGANGADIGAFELIPSCDGLAATLPVVPGQPLTGTAGDDVIVGSLGNDRINAGAGNDLVCTGDGADKVSGAAGKDTLFGEDGKDRLKGGGGRDTLSGAAGKDALEGGGGKDRLLGGPARDKLAGGGGKDKCKGGPGRDSEKSC